MDDSVPSAAAIDAHVNAARGTVPANYREDIEAVQSNGITRHEAHYVRGDDYRREFVSDSIETQTGRYKSDRWHQNANGLTVVHEQPEGLETPETPMPTVTAIDQPVKGYRVARLNMRGNGSINYVDSSTWQIVRTETIDNAGTSVTTYGPRVAFGEVNLPQTWHVHSADSRLDTDYTRVSYVAGVVRDEDVVMPSNRRVLVQFPPGVDNVTLPTTFMRDNHIVVRVTIEGIGYDFLLSSGSSGISVDPSAVAKMHLSTFNPMINSANAGPVDTSTARVSELTVGALTMHDVVVREVPMTMQEPGVRTVGELGFDFLAENGVSIDYDHKTVIMHRHGTYSPPGGAGVNVIPVRLDTQQPAVTARINGAVAERVILETGAYGSFLLFDYFARRHPEALVDVNESGRHSEQPTLIGVGGQIVTRAYALAEIDLGTTRYANFIGWVVLSKSYGGAQDGVFGAEFLKIYDVFLDYPDGCVALTLNATGQHDAQR